MRFMMRSRFSSCVMARIPSGFPNQMKLMMRLSRFNIEVFASSVLVISRNSFEVELTLKMSVIPDVAQTFFLEELALPWDMGSELEKPKNEPHIEMRFAVMFVKIALNEHGQHFDELITAEIPDRITNLSHHFAFAK